MDWLDHHQIRTGSSQSRNNPNFVPTPTYGKPVWNGEKKDITLLVNADFGYGDTIQYYRYCETAAQRVTKLILRCEEDLHHLLQVPGQWLLSKEQEFPEFDEIIHLMALPKVLECGEPNGSPYLKTKEFPKASVLDLLNLMGFTKVGLCWAGNQFNPRDSNRSIPVDLLDILRVKPGMSYFSLQKQYEPLEWFLDCRSLMSDWNATAQLVKELELVITVDTAIAHLAGAAGCRQVWLMLPKDADPRWGDGRKTCWYNNFTVFRQKQEGDWEEVLREVADLLLTS